VSPPTAKSGPPPQRGHWSGTVLAGSDGLGVGAIASLLCGRRFGRWCSAAEGLDEEGAEDVLSGRELELVLLAARGLSNGQIAASLHLSEATVKRHLANVYEKMGVSSRGEAAREALLRDWITIEEVTEDAGKEEGPG